MSFFFNVLIDRLLLFVILYIYLQSIYPSLQENELGIRPIPPGQGSDGSIHQFYIFVSVCHFFIIICKIYVYFISIRTWHACSQLDHRSPGSLRIVRCNDRSHDRSHVTISDINTLYKHHDYVLPTE